MKNNVNDRGIASLPRKENEDLQKYSANNNSDEVNFEQVNLEKASNNAIPTNDDDINQESDDEDDELIENQ